METVVETSTCCPEVDTNRWENKTHRWRNKLFIQDSVPELFHIPLTSMFSKKVGRMWKMAQKADADPALEDFLLLVYDPSPWKGVLLMSVTQEVPGIKNVKLSGTFISKVFDGPYNKIPQYIKEMDAWLAEEGKKTRSYYFYFPYCPKCAKKYGHNYIIAFAEIEIENEN